MGRYITYFSPAPFRRFIAVILDSGSLAVNGGLLASNKYHDCWDKRNMFVSCFNHSHLASKHCYSFLSQSDKYCGELKQSYRPWVILYIFLPFSEGVQKSDIWLESTLSPSAFLAKRKEWVGCNCHCGSAAFVIPGWMGFLTCQSFFFLWPPYNTVADHYCKPLLCCWGVRLSGWADTQLNKQVGREVESWAEEHRARRKITRKHVCRWACGECQKRKRDRRQPLSYADTESSLSAFRQILLPDKLQTDRNAGNIPDSVCWVLCHCMA